jgi:ABC-2 type transport system ATP-binding protein
MDRPAIVSVRGVAKRYGPRVAVDSVSFDVPHGTLYGLIGADGAGKSSLLKAVAGVLAHDAGEITVFGHRIDSEAAAEAVKSRLGFMPQGLGLNLYPELSVEENIDFFARMRLVPDDELASRKARLLAMTRLAGFRDRPMKLLSGGMKQKLGLVCTLIHAPELIVLDEPTTGVDPVSRRDFWLILAQLIEEGRLTALVSTAYLDEASRFDRLVLMHAGRVLAEDEPEALRSQASRGGERAAATGATELEDVFIELLDRQGVVADRGGTLTAAPAADARLPSAAPAGAHHPIDARELTRDFGAFRAVDRVTFSVRPGEILGLLGANGAGKTTVIKMLTGILPPSGGAGFVAGADMRRAGRLIKARIGYVSQVFSLYSDLTIDENLRLYAGIYGMGRRDAERRIATVVEMGGLAGRRRDRAGDLPMGLRQRLALGCAIVHEPQVLFLDEPTSGVDPLGRRQFWALLHHLARVQGVAILLTTHYMLEAEYCDRLALMYAGRIVADASPASMKQALTREAGELIEIAAEPLLPALQAVRTAGYPGAALHGRRIHVLAQGVESARSRIEAACSASGVQLHGIEPRALSMEDVFVHRVLALEALAQANRAAA